MRAQATDSSNTPGPGNPRAAERAIASALAGSPTDFADFDDAALWKALARHAVYPLFDQRIQQGAATGVSDALRERLALNARAHGLLDAEYRRQSQRLLALFRQAGLRALFIKGLPLAHLFYPESRLRVRVDIDVYFDVAERTPVIELLRDAGYDIQWHDTNAATSQQFTAMAPGKTLRPIHFDLHERISNRAVFGDLLPFTECWSRRQALPGLGEAAFTMATPDLLMHSALHRLAHGRASERDRLAWLYDLHLAFAAMNAQERETLAERALDARIGAVVADGLTSACLAFGTAPDVPLVERLLSRAGEEPATRLLTAGKLGWLWSDYRGQQGLGDKARFLAETLRNQLR